MSQPPYPPQSPPMSPPPPHGYTHGYVQPPRRTSVAAVLSLICGILGCFVVTGLLAVITGIIGLRATRDPNVAGRGLAIAGIILGTLFGLGGGACFVSTGGVAYWAYKQYGPAVEAVTAFSSAASSGNVDAAMNYVDASRLTKTEVQEAVDELRALGSFKEFNPTNPQINTVNGLTTVDLNGTIVMTNGSRPITVQLVKQTDGSFKFTRLALR